MSSAISRPWRPAACDEAIEILDRAEPRFDGHVSALVRSDRPRAARIVRAGRQRVVRSLAEAAADRVDRRQVQDVEPHRRDIGETRGRLVEGGAPRGVGAGRPRKHLVPRAEPRPLPLDGDPEHAVEAGRPAAIRIRDHQPLQLLRQRQSHALPGGGAGILERRGPLRQGAGDLLSGRTGRPPARRRLHALERFANQGRPFEQLAPDVLSGAELLGELRPPARKPVDPALHRVFVRADLGHREDRLPAVVAYGFHRDFAPRLVPGATVHRRRGEHIVAVAVNVGRDGHGVAGHALDRKAPAVDLGQDPLDHDTAEVRITHH